MVSEAVVPYGAAGEMERIGRLIDVLGVTLVADLIGVSKSQPSRWRSGRDKISTDNLRKVIDLDLIVARLLTHFDVATIRGWLFGNNPFLNFARPADIFVLRGLAGVLVALDGEDSGAYA